MALDRPAYRIKRHLLGKPLTTERISDEKLNNRTALGVLASDCISSSAYGSEEMLRVLVPVVGAAAFTLLMPVTGAILLVLLLLTLCYSDVVMIYTRAGGSYVVARENFGPNVAQIAAVALLVDYIVTVAVQVSAYTNALISLAHLAGGGWTGLDHLQLPVSVAVIVLLAYGNLRGIREAGRTFALPAYLFMAAVGLVLLVATVRGLTVGLPHADLHAAGVVPLGTPGSGWAYGASLFIVLRSFANGGSSLTGLEAISNGISAFREPQGRNARRTLITMSCVLGVLVLGVSTLAHFTHAVPYTDGTPTVIAQEAHLAFGRRPARDGRAGLRPAGDGPGPLHGCQHALHRLPVPRQFCRRGPFSAAGADPARAPAGVLQRDHRAHRRLAGAAARHGRQCGQAGGAVRDRRVHRVRHGGVRAHRVPPAPPRAVPCG